MKDLKCNSCGAALSHCGNSPNAKCEYCGNMVRVTSDNFYNADYIIHQIESISTRVRTDDFDSQYAAIERLIKQHRYVDASEELDEILIQDKKQARAYYYKALLPVLEKNEIKYYGRYVNVEILSKITSRVETAKYLTYCGLPTFRHRGFLKLYASTDLLFEQRSKYIDLAIANASTPERVAFFTSEKSRLNKIQRSKIRKHKTSTTLLVGLCVVVAGVLLVLTWQMIKGLL
jgi:uncharacterized Zn finger protein (UPF0148 family)